ncbi:hypothetical protein EVAR_57355_1 [Eumeta japonica]|uniref:Uncharacterized protein n=1 Tax=Eumeta variegata TaxID=151549 RepID=A0A4C1ZI51_EUMVA|nr:hypothetical protein EVAR_57355_1 [Eumeta japonica]
MMDELKCEVESPVYFSDLTSTSKNYGALQGLCQSDVGVLQIPCVGLYHCSGGQGLGGGGIICPCVGTCALDF